jgi:DNA-binding GntR family transcriptional regulator
VATDPMYRQIADDLRRQIEDGRLAPGAQLRTELELREKYNASRNTVRDAIKWLITRGLVETRPGQGTFVVEKIDPFVTTLTQRPDTAAGSKGDTYLWEVTARLRTPKASDPRVEIQKVDSKVAAELQVDVDSTVVSRHQKRYIDRTPWSLQTSFYPMDIVQRGAAQLMQAQDIDGGTIRYLREALGVKEVGWHDLLTVRAPDETETAFFKLPADGRVSVIETRRTAFDEEGTPVRLTISAYPADRNQFAVNVGDVPAKVADPTEPSQSGSAAPPSSDGASARGS